MKTDKVNPVTTTVSTGTVEEFFHRGHVFAAQADTQKKILSCSRRSFFEDPNDLIKFISERKISL